MGKIVKTFFHVLTSSIVPQTSYYARILKSRFTFSLLYFIVLLSITATVTVTLIFLRINKNSPARIEACLKTSLERIPPNYKVHIRNGVMSTNQELPLFVWFDCDDRIQLLAVIDERASKTGIHSYGAGAQILITGTDAILKYKSYSTAFPLYKYIPNLYLDKNNILDYAAKVLEIVKLYVPFFSFSLLLLTPFFIYGLNFLYILISSLFVFIFFHLFKKRYSFRKTLQIGLHSSSLPLVSSLLFMIFPINVTSTLLLYFFLIFIFQLVAVYEAHYVQPHHSPPLHKRT